MPFSVEEELRAPSEPQKEAEEELWESTEQEILVPLTSNYKQGFVKGEEL